MSGVNWTRLPIKALKPNPDNPRVIKDEKYRKLVQSIRDFPAMLEIRPIVVNADHVVLGGNMRLRACQDAGLKEVPVVLAADLTPDQQREFIIKDNVGFGEWEWDALANDWDAAKLDAWGLDLPAFDAEPATGNTDPDEVPDAPAEPVIKPGDLIALGDHRLLCGDSTERTNVVRLMDRKLVHAVLTDPPYGQNQEGVGGDAPENLEHIVKAVDVLPITDGVIITFQSPRTFPKWLMRCLSEGHQFERMLWLYKRAQNSYPWRGWLLTSEAILISTVGKPQWQDVHPYTHDCYLLAEVSRELSEEIGWHGSVKPMVVVTDLLQRITPARGLVYDPFLGSGTTLIAAEQTGRVCFGLELEPKNCDVIVKRWQDFTGRTATYADTGQPVALT